MRVLVTGGAGFIGSHVAEAALAAGHSVEVLDDLSTGRRDNVPSAALLRVVDLRDRDRVIESLRDFKPDVVSHQAAQASVVVSMRRPTFDVEVNVLGTLNLLEACLLHGVQRVVFASTGGAIYGEIPESIRADESHRPNPQSPYAISKLASEQLLAVQRREYGIDCRVLRYANVYGPRQDPHGEAGVVAIFAALALAGKQLEVFGKSAKGDAGCIRDYVYVGDVVRANLAALEGRLEANLLNVGTGIATETYDLARRVVDLCGSQSQIVHGEPRPGDVARSVLDVSLAERLIGPLTPLSHGLQETVAWFRDRPTAES